MNEANELKYRLGIDLGTNSLGIALVELDENNLPKRPIHLGVRIFSDGRDNKTKTSLAVERRTARGMRRNRDRTLARKNKLFNQLVKYGVFPADENSRKALQLLDPYELRAKGLDEKLSLPELGRAIFHLAQRRGYKSNRLDVSKDDDNEKSVVKSAIAKLREKLSNEGMRTYGEFLHKQIMPPGSKRIRQSVSADKKVDKKDVYDFFPNRKIIEDEYDLLIKKQREYHTQLLTKEVVEDIKSTIFFQRPLKPVELGKCTVYYDENIPRAYKALPSSQKFIILKDVNDLKWVKMQSFKRATELLSSEQKEVIIKRLQKSKKVKFTQLYKDLKIENPEITKFNFDTDYRASFDGASTEIDLKKNFFGEQWDKLSLSVKDQIVYDIMTLEEAELIDSLNNISQENGLELSCDQIDNICENALGKLTSGTVNYSSRAIYEMLQYMEHGASEYEARDQCGYVSTEIENRNRLPYYGKVLGGHVINFNQANAAAHEKKHGKIGNPTVHIALNQLRLVVNEILDRYGKPAEIAIELARELKMNKKQKEKHNKILKENEKLREELVEIFEQAGGNGQPSTRFFLKGKLWKEQGRVCVYSGKSISINQLIDDSALEIDHILPFSKTLDDTIANKVLVIAKYNQFKGNLSPFAAKVKFEQEGIRYDDIVQRVPQYKQWRFLADADEKFEEQDKFLARQLKDTQYMSKIASKYLSCIVDKHNIHTYAGGVTGRLRNGLGLNKFLHTYITDAEEQDTKNRDDHRHHAIDALTLCLLNRSIMQRIIEENKNSTKIEIPNYAKFIAASQLRQLLENLIISHKPDHYTKPQPNGHMITSGTSSQLHKETNFGLLDDQEDKLILRVRKPVSEIIANRRLVESICDDDIRENLQRGVDLDKNDWEKFALSCLNGIRRLRVSELKNKSSVVNIGHKDYSKYVATGGNHHIDIFCPIMKYSSGAKKYIAKKWYGEVVSHYEFNQKQYMPTWQKENPTSRLIMRLYINDMLAYAEKEKRVICRVLKMNLDGRIYFVSHNIARLHKDPPPISVKQLQLKNARKIKVSPLGKVIDPGGCKERD